MKLPPQSSPTLRIPLPLKQQVGLGETVKALTRRLGIPACAGCEQRAAALDRLAAFGPAKRD